MKASTLRGSKPWVDVPKSAEAPDHESGADGQN